MDSIAVTNDETDDHLIVPARIITATLDAVFEATAEGFETSTTDSLDLTF